MSEAPAKTEWTRSHPDKENALPPPMTDRNRFLEWLTWTAAFKSAIDKGISRPRAASLADGTVVTLIQNSYDINSVMMSGSFEERARKAEKNAAVLQRARQTDVAPTDNTGPRVHMFCNRCARDNAFLYRLTDAVCERCGWTRAKRADHCGLETTVRAAALQRAKASEVDAQRANAFADGAVRLLAENNYDITAAARATAVSMPLPPPRPRFPWVTVILGMTVFLTACFLIFGRTATKAAIIVMLAIPVLGFLLSRRPRTQ